jgi:cobalt/nickel transport system permease protein
LFAAARLPWSYLFKRLAVALPFLMFVAAGVPMSRGFADGFDFAVALLLRAMLSLTIMTTLVATTPFAALLAALEQVRVPRLLIWVLAFMYRYLFVLSDELVRMRRAKLARSLRWNLWSEFRLLGNFWGVLFVRAFERAERIHAAMCARGWSVERFLTEQV